MVKRKKPNSDNEFDFIEIKIKLSFDGKMNKHIYWDTPFKIRYIPVKDFWKSVPQGKCELLNGGRELVIFRSAE